MNDQAGKSRPQRPPVPQKKPAKPPKPTSKPVKAEGNESVTTEESKDTERQPNHSNSSSQSESSNGRPPRASTKPKVPPAKPSGNASDTNDVNSEVVNSSKPEGGEDRIDGDLSQGAQTENQNKERAKIQTSSSPKLPPRSKHPPKTELTKDKNNSLKKVNSLSNSSEPSSATVSRSSSSCSSSGEKPHTLPKPPRKKVQVKENELANNTSEIQNGEPLVIATTSPSEEQCLSSDQEVGGGRSPGQSSKIAKEEESKENQTDDQNLSGSNIVNDKKIALKPKPSRPPPPLKRTSQLKKSKSEDIPNKEDQLPKVKPKPSVIKPKSVKSPKLLTQGGGHSAIKEDVITKQKDSNLEQSQPVGGGKEENIKFGGVTNSGISNTASQPLPPPRKKRLSMIGMESQDIECLDEQPEKVATDEINETEKGTPKRPDPAPGISRSAKRASNGTMFAVIGESRFQNVVEADGSDKTLNGSPSNESQQDSVASKGDVKPRRVAPAKPPPPSQQALLKQKSMKESPNTPSPPNTPSKRPQMRPPPVPLAKPKVEPKKDSNKTRPKRPSGPPVARRATKEEVSKVKDTEEDKQEKDSGAVGDVEGDDTKELSSPAPREDGQDADVLGQELSSNSAEDVVSAESKEEPLSNRSESLAEEDDYDSDFDDDEFSDDERSSSRAEESEAEADDAAFMSTLSKERKKAYQVAKEIKGSEAVFVDVLRLLNEDFKSHIEYAQVDGQPVIDKMVLDQILGYLPQLQMFNEELLTDVKARIANWAENPKVADVFIKKGPYLKLYTTYIKDFEKLTAELEDACNRYPNFKAAVKEFEAGPRCQSLQVRHYMLKPVQRIPQYRLLLTDYQKNLEEGSEDYEDTKVALGIVSEVARHVNNLMKTGDDLEKLLNIQHSLLGQHDIVKPGRTFLKEGILNKISRKEFQQRKLFLLSDVLLTTASFPSGLRLKAELPLQGMQVTEPQQIRDHENEFNIISVERSFTLAASSPEEKEEWMTAINKAVEAVMEKRSTFLHDEKLTDEEKKEAESTLGNQAPVWIPDARVTMCQICTSEFTMTYRRHHCRACGKVVCGNCSKDKVYLEYLKKNGRVCDECSVTLSAKNPVSPSMSMKVKRRKSHVTPSKSKILKEVSATDDDITIKGYLQYKEKKSWKRMWFVVKDKVLYTYKASEDVAAESTFPLIGFNVSCENGEIKLTQAKISKFFKADSQTSTDEWMTAFQEATQLG